MQRKVGTSVTIAPNRVVDLDLILSNPGTKARPRPPSLEFGLLTPTM
jgi:hypothetical protein